jgi:hypothetical protein
VYATAHYGKPFIAYYTQLGGYDNYNYAAHGLYAYRNYGYPYAGYYGPYSVGNYGYGYNYGKK